MAVLVVRKKAKVLLAVVLAVGLVLPTGCRQTLPDSSRGAGAGTTAIGREQARFDYRFVELDNGLDVITLEDFSCPIVAVQLWYHVGSKNEQPDRQGFAHMFEHMMFRGTDRLGPTDHFAFIRRTGGSTNAYTSFDRTVYFETLPASQLELALWLEAERMTFLRIDQESFDTERKVVEEERRMGLNEPYGTVFERLLENIYSVHPYRWPPIGKISHLRASSVQELREFWQSNYVPSNATLIVVGAVTHEQARAMAETYFGWIPRYDEPPEVSVVEPEPKGPRKLMLDKENAPTPSVSVIFRTIPLSHPDTESLDLLSQILGSGKSSRLYRDLVAEKQLAVETESWHWSLQQDGLLQAQAVMPPTGSDPNEVLAAIEDHIARFRTEPVSRRELLKAKNRMLRNLVTEGLKIENKARMLGSAAVTYGDVSQVNRWLDDIRAVTPDDILRVANKYLSEKRMMRVHVKRNLPDSLDPSIAAEQNAPITAEPEEAAPEPGRAGLVRPPAYPKQAPFADISADKLTPRYSSRVLNNGLKVLVVPNDEVPFVTAQLGLLAGAWTERKPGTTSMALQMLTKGTSEYTEAELADEMETYAISISGRGQMDTSMVTMSCLTEQLERGMSLLSQVVLEPTFPEDEFEKLRKQVLTLLAVRSAAPEYIVDRELRKHLYGSHPYSRTATGEIEDVNALRPADITQWWSEFARADMAVLIIAGDIEEEQAYRLAEETFGSWKPVGPKPDRALPSVEPPAHTHIYLIDKPGSIQSQIRVAQLGITRRDNGYFVSRVVSSYFGWAFNSRLNETVRVAKGLTYGVWGGYTAQRFAGEFTVGTFSKPESTAEAVRAVIDEIKRLKTEGPTSEELESSRSYILGSFVRHRETPQQIAADLWLIGSQGLGKDYFDRLLKGVTGTQRDDCTRLIRGTIEPDNLVIVVVGEADRLKEELEEIAPVTVVPAKQASPKVVVSP
jgi:zinc protease